MPAVLCTNCGVNHARHSTAEFPSVNLCFPCVRDFIGNLYLLGVADGNPLVALYFYDAPHVWLPSEYGGFESRRLKGFKLVPIK